MAEDKVMPVSADQSASTPSLESTLLGRIYLYTKADIDSPNYRRDFLAWLDLPSEEQERAAFPFYPALAAYGDIKDAPHRIFGQFHLDRQIEGHVGQMNMATYGDSAIAYQEAIALILARHPDPNPDILVLGAQTPGAVRQVANFCERFTPSSLTLADMSEASVVLGKAYAQQHGHQVNGVVADFTSREQTQQLPLYDIALGDRLLYYITDGSGERTADKNFESVI